MTRYVKLTNESCCHNGFQYAEGLNTDIHEFNTDKVCDKGGLYFCKYEDFGEWIDYNTNGPMYWMWDVTIPENETIINMNNKLKVHSFALSNKKSIWDNKELCLEVVQQDGCSLMFVKEQTEEICLEAVRQDGEALQHVKKQTKEMCLEAVRQYGLALEFVEEQTDEICLEALRQDGRALEYVERQTKEMCLEAVKQNGKALEYVNKNFYDACKKLISE